MNELVRRSLIALLEIVAGVAMVYYHTIHLFRAPPLTPAEGFITHPVLIVTMLLGIALAVDGFKTVIDICKGK